MPAEIAFAETLRLTGTHQAHTLAELERWYGSRAEHADRPDPRARHVYEKIGFIHEGTGRQALRWDGGWLDAHIMSILAPEWAGHRGRPGTVPRRQVVI